MSGMDTNWQVHSLEDVMRYFISAFEPKEGREIYRLEYYIDVTKGQVAFEITTKDKTT